MSFSLTANFVDIQARRIYPARVTVIKQRISSIEELDGVADAESFILPGFVDAHVHIESSMLVPAEFARLAVVHGTVATVSDPHEIANVCGMEGVDFMITNGKTVPFKFYFGAPSCVPATPFETSGAVLGVAEVEQLLERDEIHYLSEMMNFPGAIAGDEEVLAKIAAAARLNKPVDGHAPGLRGDDLLKYLKAGISTDHECFTREEALEKLQHGMKILIREGSAARNFDALIDLLREYPDAIMFCSDDKHPDSLLEGHINQLCSRAVARGIDLFNVLQAACLNPVRHYNLDVGLLRPDDPADFIVVKDLKSFEPLQTYIDGELVAEKGRTKIERAKNLSSPLNNFSCSARKPQDFLVQTVPGQNQIPVIEALDGQLITHKLLMTGKIENGFLVTDAERDILKIVVLNRYHDAPPAIAFIRNFGLKRGAIASSVAHDSHNIVAVGVDDESLCRAVNSLIACKGGVSCVDEHSEQVLPLPVAGLMSPDDGYKVAEQYQAIDAAAKALGSALGSPFMTLSFMALLVIPELKLSDKGLFDGHQFKFVSAQGE